MGLIGELMQSQPDLAAHRQRGVRKEAISVGPDLCHFDYCLFSYGARLCTHVREVAIGGLMSLETVVSLIVSALLLFYLAYALLRPEKF